MDLNPILSQLGWSLFHLGLKGCWDYLQPKTMDFFNNFLPSIIYYLRCSLELCLYLWNYCLQNFVVISILTFDIAKERMRLSEWMRPKYIICWKSCRVGPKKSFQNHKCFAECIAFLLHKVEKSNEKIRKKFIRECKIFILLKCIWKMINNSSPTNVRIPI